MNFRTTASVDLCRTMRESQDFSALPVLADALEEAGYDDPAVLMSMRRPGVSRAEGCLLVGRVESPDTAAAADAVDRIAGMARDAHESADSILRTALHHLDNEYDHDAYVCFGDTNYPEPDSEEWEEFWAAVRLLTGAAVPPGYGASFFICAC